MSKSEKNQDVEWKYCVSAMFARELSEATVEIGKKLKGKLLTQIDASISDPTQRKAMKDVFKEIFNQNYHDRFGSLIRVASNELGRLLDDWSATEQGYVFNDPKFHLDENKLDYKYSREVK